MIIRKRVGSVVPCEDVDPHTGSFLTYGVIIGWIDEQGHFTSRRKASRAMIERSGRRFGEWNEWCEKHAWYLDPLLDIGG